ncbi:hypothetical protein J6590_053342 [Homalodisca vitripennis]|nr:hypothetical protein J6590_053342 [Homalodisca vitripennis]
MWRTTLDHYVTMRCRWTTETQTRSGWVTGQSTRSHPFSPSPFNCPTADHHWLLRSSMPPAVVEHCGRDQIIPVKNTDPAPRTEIASVLAAAAGSAVNNPDNNSLSVITNWNWNSKQ